MQQIKTLSRAEFVRRLVLAERVVKCVSSCAVRTLAQVPVLHFSPDGATTMPETTTLKAGFLGAKTPARAWTR